MEIEHVTSDLKTQTWSTSEGNEATTPGAVSLVKGNHYPGTIKSSIFPENKFSSVCQMEKWNASISKEGNYSECLYPTKWFSLLPPGSGGCAGGLETWMFQWGEALICTSVAFRYGALSLEILWEKQVHCDFSVDRFFSLLDRFTMNGQHTGTMLVIRCCILYFLTCDKLKTVTTSSRAINKQC